MPGAGRRTCTSEWPLTRRLLLLLSHAGAGKGSREVELNHRDQAYEAGLGTVHSRKEKRRSLRCRPGPAWLMTPG